MARGCQPVELCGAFTWLLHHRHGRKPAYRAPRPSQDLLAISKPTTRESNSKWAATCSIELIVPSTPGPLLVIHLYGPVQCRRPKQVNLNHRARRHHCPGTRPCPENAVFLLVSMCQTRSTAQSTRPWRLARKVGRAFVCRWPTLGLGLVKESLRERAGIGRENRLAGRHGFIVDSLHVSLTVSVVLTTNRSRAQESIAGGVRREGPKKDKVASECLLSVRRTSPFFLRFSLFLGKWLRRSRTHVTCGFM